MYRVSVCAILPSRIQTHNTEANVSCVCVMRLGIMCLCGPYELCICMCNITQPHIDTRYIRICNHVSCVCILCLCIMCLCMPFILCVCICNFTSRTMCLYIKVQYDTFPALKTCRGHCISNFIIRTKTKYNNWYHIVTSFARIHALLAFSRQLTQQQQTSHTLSYV